MKKQLTAEEKTVREEKAQRRIVWRFKLELSKHIVQGMRADGTWKQFDKQLAAALALVLNRDEWKEKGPGGK